MFIIRLGSTCSMQISSTMPPLKKMKTADSDSDRCADYPELVNVESESDDEAVDFGCDWRDKCKLLRHKYNYALKNSILTDVKLLVGEQGTLFHCHRLILALGSPVFEAMFYGELAETGDTVTIPDVDPEGFHHLIKFLYNGLCCLKNDVIAFKTYFAADKYCVTELKKRCERFLCLCDVKPSNVWLFFENSLFLNSQAIKERCMDVLKKNLKPSLEQRSFLDINLNTMECFLGLEDLNISEEKILMNVIQWAEHQSQMEGADSFENTLRPLLSNIRFGALTAKEFVDLRHNTRLKEVLSNDDSLLILEHLTNPLLSQLPDWCCSKKQRYCEPPPAAPKAFDSVKLLDYQSSLKNRRFMKRFRSERKLASTDIRSPSLTAGSSSPSSSYSSSSDSSSSSSDVSLASD